MTSTTWLQWIILSALTGSPVMSAAVLLAFYWAVDRLTFRFLPNPARWIRRWMRQGNLERTLQNNPNDRRARLELGELLLERRPARAVELLRPNLEAGDEDLPTLMAMARACLGARHLQQGEALLDAVESVDPQFRMGAVFLERGRSRLNSGDAQGAQEPLRRFLEVRKSSVEGRVLLARALERSGDDGQAALIRADAWREYTLSPRFLRNTERLWAWRARPSRPITYAAVAAVIAFTLFRFVLPALPHPTNPYGDRFHRTAEEASPDDE